MGRECKGICGTIKSNTIMNYKNGVRCTVCSDKNNSCWYSRDITTCPCCKVICRRTPVNSKYRLKYISYQKTA